MAYSRPQRRRGSHHKARQSGVTVWRQRAPGVQESFEMYDIKVQTVITRSDGAAFWSDEMQWFGVDDEVRNWLAGSCKTALFRLLGEPEVAEGESYTLAYRTLVSSAGRTVSDTTLVEFPRLSYDTIADFEAWAMAELRAMQVLLIEKHRRRAPAPRLRRGSRLGRLF
ncbi:MAG: hypothetical protein KGL43_28035, partial [Burkholderiales bacterium]|nr:hypothetical protein [Burkholderiales bacterium]